MMVLWTFLGVANDGFIKPKSIDKAWVASDPAAALVGYMSTIFAVFGVFEWLGLTADQVTILGGAVLGVVATLRIFHERDRRKEEEGLKLAHVELEVAHEELKRKTSRVLRREDFVEEGKEERPGLDA